MSWPALQADSKHFCRADEAAIESQIQSARHPFTRPRGDINILRDKLMDIMWENVGVMRTAETLDTALAGLEDIESRLLQTGLGDSDAAFNLSWHDWLNLRSLVEISQVIARAAISRENSRGAHYREDFPEVGDLHSSYFTVATRQRDALSVAREAVEFTIVKPGESLSE